MRKLASIQKINEIKPIEGADLIVCATINGWSLVVKKDEFKENDLCVYFEIDSFLPIDDQRFSFLESKCKSKMGDLVGLRLKTIKLKGQVSQGLILPITQFPEILNPQIGDDVTDLLKVIKYDPPIPAELAGVAKGLFPSFIKKTDEERIQNLPQIIKDFAGKEFNATVKLDGSSCTMYFNNGEFGVCSRNLELVESDSNSLWKMAKKYDVYNKLKKLNKNIALQGELIGEGIQKNHEKLKGQDWFIFKIWLIDDQKYASFEEVTDILKVLGLEPQRVPKLPSFLLPSTMEEVLALADGPSLFAEKREGIVVEGFGLSFKVISNWYLLKNE